MVLSLVLGLDSLDRLMHFIWINMLVLLIYVRVKLFQKQIYPGSFTTGRVWIETTGAHDFVPVAVLCFSHFLIDAVDKIEWSEDGNDFLELIALQLCV